MNQFTLFNKSLVLTVGIFLHNFFSNQNQVIYVELSVLLMELEKIIYCNIKNLIGWPSILYFIVFHRQVKNKRKKTQESKTFLNNLREFTGSVNSVISLDILPRVRKHSFRQSCYLNRIVSRFGLFLAITLTNCALRAQFFLAAIKFHDIIS